MPKIVIVIVLAMVIFLLFKFYITLKLRQLKCATDDEFIADFLYKYNRDNKDEILEARKIVAGYFGLPKNKITVCLRLSDLAKILIFSPSYSLSVNDIMYDLCEYYKCKPTDIVLAETAGELVNMFVAKLKREGNP